MKSYTVKASTDSKRDYAYWTPEEDRRLRELWSTGMTFREMTREFQHRSRNALLGRAFRIGLLTRASKLQVSHGSVL